MKKEIISAPLSKALQISKVSYFNSEKHFYEDLHIETGYSVNTLKKELKPHFTFENDRMVGKSVSGVCYNNLPNFILSTRKIKDGSYWLKEREYQVLVWLDSLRMKVAEINEKRETNSPIYASVKGIARTLNCTYSEAINSMHKLELYFEGFWVYEDNFDQRIHPNSCSLTIKLPPRKEWKKIIEAKVMELTGLTNLTIDKPYYVGKEDMKILKKKWQAGVRQTIWFYSKIKARNRKQNARLMEDKEKKQEEKAQWIIFYEKILNFFSTLIEIGEISEVTERQELKLLRIHDPEDREQRLATGLSNLQIKYPAPLNNTPTPC